MDELLDIGRRAPGPSGRLLLRAAEAFALAGSAIFVAIAIMSVASIASRAVFSKPLSGDYELVQQGCGVFVALCLPLCQMRYGNIIVDFFTTRLPSSTQRTLDAIGALLLALVMTLLAWRIGVGTIDMRAAGETTTILGWPVWWTYAAMVPGVALTALAGFYTAIERLREAARERERT